MCSLNARQGSLKRSEDRGWLAYHNRFNREWTLVKQKAMVSMMVFIEMDGRTS